MPGGFSYNPTTAQKKKKSTAFWNQPSLNQSLTALRIDIGGYVNRVIKRVKNIKSYSNVDGTDNQSGSLVRTPLPSPLKSPLYSRHLPPPSPSSHHHLSLSIARFSQESIFQETDRWIDLYNQTRPFSRHKTREVSQSLLLPGPMDALKTDSKSSCGGGEVA